MQQDLKIYKNQTFQAQIPQEERVLEEILEYKKFFDSDLNVIQEFLERKELNQDDRRQIKLLKTNYKKILSHKDYVLRLNSGNKYSQELIKFIYDSNLQEYPIKRIINTVDQTQTWIENNIKEVTANQYVNDKESPLYKYPDDFKWTFNDKAYLEKAEFNDGK